MWYELVEANLSAEREISATVKIDGNSPWFSGHFPGAPILPGISQLGMVADLISKFSEDDLCIKSLSRVKFKKIIKPGELLFIRIFPGSRKDTFSFQILIKDEDVCSGAIVLKSKEK